ncbi:hypothetical protein BDF22DRAFT_690323 [Syncephalis plumigaleata]|nr:hypothetical protein BDF22DRAFT_690323 [Syncephalis plumigaleata]
MPWPTTFLLLQGHRCIHTVARRTTTTTTLTVPFSSTIRRTRTGVHCTSMPSPDTSTNIHFDSMNTANKPMDRLSAVANPAATTTITESSSSSSTSTNTMMDTHITDQLSFPYQLPATNEFTCNDEETKQALIASSETLHAGLPVETVYGLAANALDVAAVQRIFHAKGRPSDNPLIVHISSLSMLIQVVAPWSTLGKVAMAPDTQVYPPSTYDTLSNNGVGADADADDVVFNQQNYDAIESTFAQLELPVAVRCIIRKGWPGPLTLLLPRHPRLPVAVTCGRPTVGVRFPAHPMARAMIAHANLPLAAPSANTSGRPSPTRAQHVFTDLRGRIPLILDAGACRVGVESTVLDCARTPPAILRPGGVTDVELRQWAGSPLDQLQYAQLELAPTTPGMKYLILFESKSTLATNRQQMRQCVLDKAMELYQAMNTNTQHAHDQHHPVIGLLSIDDNNNDDDHCLIPVDTGKYPYIQQYSLGTSNRPDQVAHRLFDGLRTLDASPHLAWILVEGIPDQGQGIAVMNRLRKAASSVVHV